MKSKIKILFAVAVFGLAATGCQKDNNGTKTGETGEKSTISLIVTTNQASLTRGTTQTETPTTDENKIVTAKGLKVYVFRENGTLDYSGTLTLDNASTDTYLSGSFEVSAGDLYFYVFANDNGYLAPVTTNRNDFITSALPVVFTRDMTNLANPDSLNIANPKEGFLIGTLWSGSTAVAAGGTKDNPVKVKLQIGRLVSKVSLDQISYANGDNSGLKGKFSEGKYRIGSLPRKINTVGVYTGSIVPPADNAMVVSYMHNSPYSGENYLDYSQPWTEPGKGIFYATENTTALDSEKRQFFGTTSYLQIQTIYTPALSEVYNPATGKTLEQESGSLTDGNFWTGIVNGVRLIFSADPTASEHFTGVEKVQSYVGGMNYHKFPIFDKNEKDDVMRNRVLRNHYYEFNITKFNDLGSPEGTVEPTELVPTKTTVQVEVNVLPWSKVTAEVEVG